VVVRDAGLGTAHSGKPRRSHRARRGSGPLKQPYAALLSDHHGTITFGRRDGTMRMAERSQMRRRSREPVAWPMSVAWPAPGGNAAHRDGSPAALNTSN
jgi:hypothetical protein